MIERKVGLKRHTPIIKKVSRTQYRRLNRYRNIRSWFLETHTECAIKRPGCTHESKFVHHGKGKIGELLFETEYFVPVCDGPCHRWAEENVYAAMELGISWSRLKKDDNE